MLNWNKINTVLLDMDGTLLDLNFDNHFWLEFIPARYAQKNNLSLEQTMAYLVPLFKSMEGRLEWYCLDYWSAQLDLNIAQLKTEVAALIRVLPHVTDFLSTLQRSDKKIILVTNAHPDALALKMQKTGLQVFFDEIICAHTIGFAKENSAFWHSFQQQSGWQKQSTLMVDDSLPVLRAAQQFGVQYLRAMQQPDSSKAAKIQHEFLAITDFRELLPL